MRTVILGAMLMAWSILVLAQKLERPKDVDVGDKATSKWIHNNKLRMLDQEVISVTNTEVHAVERVGGNETELTYTKSPRLIQEGLCLGSGTHCRFEPGVESSGSGCLDRISGSLSVELRVAR